MYIKTNKMVTPTKTPFQSTNFWTGILTVIAAAFAYFGVAPDLAVSNELADTTKDVVDAVVTKNYALLFGVLINVTNIVQHFIKTYFKK